MPEGLCRHVRGHAELWHRVQSSARKPRNHPAAWSMQGLAVRSHHNAGARISETAAQDCAYQRKGHRLWGAATPHIALSETYQIPLGGKSDRHQCSCVQRKKLKYERLSNWPRVAASVTREPGSDGSSGPEFHAHAPGPGVLNPAPQERNPDACKSAEMPGPHPAQ